MPQMRPTAITVIAVLQFVFGGLGLMGDLCGLGMQAAGGANAFTFGGATPQAQNQQDLQKDLQKALDEKAPAAKPVQFATLGLDLVISALMIISGIGLLKMQSWGRSLSILYAILSILLKIFGVIYAAVVTIPVLQEVIQPMAAKGQQAEATAMFMKIGIYVGVGISALTIVYPIIVLVIMFHPKIVAAFRGEAVLPAEQDVDDRYEEDERWGR